MTLRPLALCALSALAPLAAAQADPGPGTLFHGGRIRLGDGAGTTVEALLARDGRVVAVGDLAQLEARADAAAWTRVDLRGGTAVPGLQDAHGHLSSLGASLERVDLLGCSTYEELVRRVAEQAADLPPGSWVLGRGWDHTLWPGAEFPHHAALSAATPEHPVFLERVDGHSGLANALAMELAGMVGDAADLNVAGGRIERGADGAPTGVLVDAAMGLVERHVPSEEQGDFEQRVLRAQAAALAVGLTAVHDMGMDLEDVHALRRMAREGSLQLRVHAYLWGNQGLDEAGIAALEREGPAGKVDLVGVKLMIDGALGSRGAALHEDYHDAPGERGLLLVERDELARLVQSAARLGLQPATHAIGDRGNTLVLDVYAERQAQQASFRELRPRIEHAQVVRQADWGRFPELGVIPSVQPTHCTTDMRWAEDRLGAERVLGAYAWRRLDPDLVHLAFGSDFPVESPDPLLGLYAARARQDVAGWPEDGWQVDQRVGAGAALAGFTRGAAWAVFEEHERGRLLPGFAADLSVFSVDPVRCTPEELLTAQALYTVIDGEVCFAAPE